MTEAEHEERAASLYEGVTHASMAIAAFSVIYKNALDAGLPPRFAEEYLLMLLRKIERGGEIQ